MDRNQSAIVMSSVISLHGSVSEYDHLFLKTLQFERKTPASAAEAFMRSSMDSSRSTKTSTVLPRSLGTERVIGSNDVLLPFIDVKY